MSSRREENENHDVRERIRNIENKLIGNSNSILERIARIEIKHEQLQEMITKYHEVRLREHEEMLEKTITTVKSKMEDMNILFSKQVEAQFRANKYQIIGLWIAVLSVMGLLVSQALASFHK